MDSKGNLYGTTTTGGSGICSNSLLNSQSGCGTIFKVDTSGKETVLYSFTSLNGDGQWPSASLIMDKAGNLYGTTTYGGTGDCTYLQGSALTCGIVFKLDTSGKETVLHTFTALTGDGGYPIAGLIMDSKGNLYGTTYEGGTAGTGTAFKINTSGNETVLHSFTGSDGDGSYPSSGLIMDSKGYLYGVTSASGAYGGGTVYKLDSSGNETVLYSFGASGAGTPGDGSTPRGDLVMDKTGNLYGTTSYGGAYGAGTVWRLDTAGHEAILHSFENGPLYGGPGDGATPWSGVIMDKAGNLYGTTVNGGATYYQLGTVFKIDASGNETVLHSFGTESPGAQWPYGGLIINKSGALLGTTAFGGLYGVGTVFKLVP